MVLQFMDDNAIEITMFREGKAAWADKYDKVIRRFRPTAPLMLVNADDNDLDLYYTKRCVIDGKNKTDKYYRPKLYVVIDTAYNYVLGYAVGETVTVELIKEAFRNAQYHIKQLTGSHHIWGQLVTDRWGVGENTELKRYFESQAKFTPPPAGQPRSKAIEQSFGTLWHKILAAFDNYAGPGINAKRKGNADFIAENIKHNAKPHSQIQSDVETFVNTLRLSKWKDSERSRQELWLADFAAQNVSDSRAISDETYLMTFGTPHTQTNRATNEGIKITIDKQKYIYDIPFDVYRSVVGKQMQIYYDLSDMSRVLATDGKHRFIATSNTAMAMALEDMREGDRERLNRLLEEKQMHKVEILDQDMYERELLERHGINARSLIKAGVLKKSIQQEATKIAQIPIRSLEDTIINIHSLM